MSYQNNISRLRISAIRSGSDINIGGTINIHRTSKRKFICKNFFYGDYNSQIKGTQNLYIDPDSYDYTRQEIIT